jgi:hypothetical protein
LKYGLLTKHTAFVAVDSEGGRAQGGKRSVEQPAPHPKGMKKKGRNTLDFSSAQIQGTTAQRRQRSRSAPRATAPPSLGGSGRGRGGGGVAHGKGAARRGARRRAAEPEADALASAPEEEAPAKARLRVEVGTPLLVEGDVDARRLERAVARILRRLSSALSRLGATGRVVAELEVDADGKVTKARIIDGALDAPAAQARILAELRRRGLPAAALRSASTVRIPIRLR